MDFDYITVNDYARFIDDTHYMPDLDVLEGDGALITDIRLNFGRSPDVPILRLSYRDAIAYATWSGFRLPTADELQQHFSDLANAMQPTKWQFYCWTCTEVAGKIVVLNGPYFFQKEIIRERRMTVSSDYINDFEPIALRLCR